MTNTNGLQTPLLPLCRRQGECNSYFGGVSFGFDKQVFNTLWSETKSDRTADLKKLLLPWQITFAFCVLLSAEVAQCQETGKQFSSRCSEHSWPNSNGLSHSSPRGLESCRWKKSQSQDSQRPCLPHVVLPIDWRADREQEYPVIVEYAGNGPYESPHGDRCTGKVEDCRLSYGVSGGKEFIWVCLPCISKDGTRNQLKWWGDPKATVEYCKQTVPKICEQYNADPEAVFVAGFSRGAIACNYIGLIDNEIAKLWRGFICHSHYDGVRSWGYPAAIANRRLCV